MRPWGHVRAQIGCVKIPPRPPPPPPREKQKTKNSKQPVVFPLKSIPEGYPQHDAKLNLPLFEGPHAQVELRPGTFAGGAESMPRLCQSAASGVLHFPFLEWRAMFHGNCVHRLRKFENLYRGLLGGCHWPATSRNAGSSPLNKTHIISFPQLLGDTVLCLALLPGGDLG